MKRQPSISPAALSRLFAKAVEAWRRQDYQETIALLQRAQRSDPGNPNILLDLGRAYGLRYDYPQAEQCFDRAARLTPRKADVFTEAGRRCQEFGHVEMAARFFERAALEPKVKPETLVVLAELYERRAHYDQAAELLGRALHLQADHPAALLAQARLARLRGDITEADRSLRALLTRQLGEDPTRIRAWYELGAVLDRQGRYDEAMTAFLEAKATQRPAAAPFAQVLHGVQSSVRELEQTISAGVLERWAQGRAALAPARRLAILCGHPRSGTTLLEQVLDAHPTVVSAEETHILHDEAYLPLTAGFAPTTSILQVLDSAPPSRLGQARGNYFRFTESYLGQPLGERLLVDKNPALNVLLPAVARIFPEAKLLVAVRDPRDVCLSCFMQPLPLNPVSSAYLSLEGTVQQYASVMGFWRAMLPRLRNPWLEVRYEELVADLESVVRRALSFLEIDWNECVLRFHEHARRKALRSPTYADVRQPVHGGAVGRWRNYEKHLEPYVGRLQPFLEAFGYA
ncbi:MAG: sulfotransferase [Verrucomicrobia bacterium]|nr:sulfotransferase [Verrucomicrobiota bacterium]